MAGPGGDALEQIMVPECGGGPLLGGGGGGARITGTLASNNGGAGARGQVIITYVDASNFSTSATSPICSGTSTTVTMSSTTLAAGSYNITYSTTNPTNNTGTATVTFSGTTTKTGSFTISGLTGPSSLITIKTITFTGWTCSNTLTSGNTATVTVNQKSANPTSATASAPSVCSGGSVNLTLGGGGGGTGEVVNWYSGSCGGTFVGTGNPLPVFNITATTTYFGRYEDPAPCNFNSTCASVTVTVQNITASAAHTDVTCNGGADGTATITASGGTTPPYSYTLGATTNSTGIFTGLAAGTYSYSVKDALNCTPVTGSVTIQQPAVLNANVASTDVSCNGLNDGTITISNPTGGFGTYQYTINGGSTWQSPNVGGSYTFTNLPPATYNVQIRDAAHPSCVITLNGALTINQPDAIVLSVSSTNVSCNGGTNGTITASASGGISNTYGGTPSITVNGVPYNPNATYGAGTYTVVASDDNSNFDGGTCTETQIVTITEPNALIATISGDATICTGQSTPITVTLSGGTAPYTVTYNGTPHTGSSPITFNVSPTSNTTYDNLNVSVTDSHGCTSSTTGSATVTVNTAPVITSCPNNDIINTDPGVCYASKTYSAIVTGSPAPTVTYSINGNPITFPYNFPTGITTVTATAHNSCSPDASCSFTVTVNDTENPTITAPGTVTVSSDPGSCSATNVSLGTPITADNCGVQSVTNDAPASYPNGNTTVTWTVTDIHGNTATATQTVTVNDTENPVINGTPSNITQSNDPDQCGAVVTWTPATVSDNCPGSTISSDHQPGDVFPIGTTTVTYTATDAHGNSAASTSFTITVNDTQNPVINGTPSNITQSNDPGQCSAVVTWTPATVSDNCPGSTISSDHQPGDVVPPGNQLR